MAGLRIAGVKSLSEDTPFRVYNGLTEYSQWQFTYLDLEQQKLPGQGRPGGKQPQQPGGLGGRGPGQNPGRVNQPGNAGGNRP
jgi:hypothetical protein